MLITLSWCALAGLPLHAAQHHRPLLPHTGCALGQGKPLPLSWSLPWPRSRPRPWPKPWWVPLLHLADDYMGSVFYYSVYLDADPCTAQALELSL